MDLASIIGYIANLGFPSIICVILFWKMDKQDEYYKASIHDLSEALNNNTLAIEKLTERMT